MTEILTVDELAALLKMSKGQVYEMTRARTRSGAMRDNPIPVVKINGNVRFRKSDIEDWIEKLATHGR
jgi:excisionase family DNA binding protein